jgi:hypothetical protein
MGDGGAKFGYLLLWAVLALTGLGLADAIALVERAQQRINRPLELPDPEPAREAQPV